MADVKTRSLHQRRHPRRYVAASCALLLATVTLAGAFRHAAFFARIERSRGGVPWASSAGRPHCVPNARPFRGSSRSDLLDVGAADGRRRCGSMLGATPPRPSRLRMSARPSSDVDQVPARDASVDEAGDEAEWRTVLSAFRMYKAAYGDLKVPAKFVVPGMAPWPEPAWKLKLGQRVGAIRSTGRYVQQNEPRRKTLDDMGFLWRLRAPSPGTKLNGIAFEQVAAALEAYRAQAPLSPPANSLDVPPQFVVPDCEPWPDATRGLPLGKILPTVRSPAYLARHPEAAARLVALGFPPDIRTAAANDTRYQRVYDALVRYKELYGDLYVPTAFTVPEDDGDERADAWPKEVRGLRLGARVNAIRSQGTFVKTNPARKAELDTLGFVWDAPTDGEGTRRRGRKRKDEADDDEGEDRSPDDGEERGATTTAAARFVVPAPEESPFDMTRDPFFTGDQRRPPQWAFEREDDEEAALEQQQAKERKYAAPKSFNETLEEMAQVAISVGVMERWTPQKRVKKGTRPNNIPWRNDDFGSNFVFDDVVEALSLYKKLYNNFDNIAENEFVVPEPVVESLRLSPFELAGMNDNSRDDLDEMDGPWSEDEDGESLESEFSVVAHDDWPGHLGGMKLGRIASRIREGALEVKHLPKRKARLDAIGFDWGDPKRFIDVPFEKVLCMLYAYFMIRGDTRVIHNFVMPDEDPWPTVFAGFELGAAVVRLRELQNFLEAYHPMKMSQLRMFDFQFLPELALPLDPDAGEMDPEHLYVETFGHPLYHISAVPLGLPERMLANGPSGPPGKRSSWYNYEYVREIYDRPGSLSSVADWMRNIGFNTLAEEHEQKYGLSYFRRLSFLKEKLNNTEISQETWDEEIQKIQGEIAEEFENWTQSEQPEGAMDVNDGEVSELDYSISEDEYYFQSLELASNSRDSLPAERPTTILNNVIEESVAEFSLDGGDGDNEPSPR